MTTTILVTGGGGFLGSHCCKALAAEGYLPVAYDNLSRGFPELVRWGPLEIGDILDSGRLEEVFVRYRPQAVIHFAGLAYVGESISEPEAYFSNNVAGTLCLLAAMRKVGVGALVFSSSCTVYGDAQAPVITEDSPTEPISPYGWSKLMAERVIAEFGMAYGLRSVRLRYFNAAGGDPDAEIGEMHDPETHLFPLALDAALGRSRHLSIFGDDYPTPDGTCIRDYVHVLDLIDAHLLALQQLLAGSRGGCFNLGSGTPYSVRDIVAAVERVSGRPVPVSVAPRRPGDPPFLCADWSRAKQALGWSPTRSVIDVMVADALRWRQRQER